MILFFYYIFVIFFFLFAYILSGGRKMDKIDSNNYSQTITLIERKSLMTSGVKKIENFDDKQFLMDTVLGYLLVKGEDLELIKLDTIQGIVSIKGKIDSMTYLEEDTKKEKENSLFNRLFK